MAFSAEHCTQHPAVELPRGTPLRASQRDETRLTTHQEVWLDDTRTNICRDSLKKTSQTLGNACRIDQIQYLNVYKFMYVADSSI